MSAVENSLVLRFLPREGQEPPALNLLPNEILYYIFTFLVTPTTEWRHVVTYSRICKHFTLVLKQFDQFQIWYAITKSIPSTFPTELKGEIKVVAQLGSSCHLETLSSAHIKGSKVRYMRSQWMTHRFTLFILSFSDKGFNWTKVNVRENLQATCTSSLEKHGLTFNVDHFFSVVNCHPTNDGFIVVLQGGISIWKYNALQQPECLSFYSPFNYCPEDRSRTYILSSTYKDGVLCLMTGLVSSEIAAVYHIDLNQKEPNFNQLVIGRLQNSRFKLLHSADGLLLIEHLQDRAYPEEYKIAITKRNINGNQIEYAGVRVPQFPTLMFDLDTSVKIMGNWILVSQELRGNKKQLTIYESGYLSCWIDENRHLIPPSEFNDEHVLLIGDFLCLSYSTYIKIIHVTTKKEYTDKLAPFLKSMDEKAVLCDLHLEMSSEGEFLHVLWQVKDEFAPDDFVLKSVKIPLQTPTLNLPSESATVSKSCDHKIVIIAGAALALIALIATFVLAFTYSGAPLLETNGFTLTIPTVVTFVVGETTALVVVCLGIYLRKRK